VKAEVERLIKNCARAGGFILAPVHNIQADTSLENILAFYEAAKEYGQYPMRL
jgi:uroporphyrinogen decarboxylase